MIKKEFEIFENDNENFRLNDLERNNKEPSAKNRDIRIKKFKITIIPIVETRQIYIERLKKLYEEETNWHNKEALNNYAENNFGMSIADLLAGKELKTIEDKKEALRKIINNISIDIKIPLKDYGSNYTELYFRYDSLGYCWTLG